MDKKVLVLAVLAALTFPIAIVGAVYFLVVPSSDTAMTRFVEFGGPGEPVTEEMQMDPLIVSRGDVVPRVIGAISSKSLPKRRYAIGFLGNSGRRDALPALRRILKDPTERDLIRGDALEAIAMIDLIEGRRLAAGLSSRSDYLGDIAKGAQRGELYERRSYRRALHTYLCVTLTGC